MTKRKSSYVTLQKFVEHIRELKIKSGREYRNLYEHGYISKKLYPKNPATYYAKRNVFMWLPFKEARKLVHKLDLKSVHEWVAHCKSIKRIRDVPTVPSKAYKGKGWIGMKDWLGTGLDHKNYPSYDELKRKIRKAKITSAREYTLWVRKIRKSKGFTYNTVPLKPDQYYKGKGWKSWGKFTGTDNIRLGTKKWKSYKTAKQAIRKVRPRIKGYSQFLILSKKDKLPKGIPSDPAKVYKNKGWEGWKAFLGYKTNYHGGWKKL
ncbi:hypothetical protein CL622_07615 [archaeon]|nr:hypothetical protein [archaeon]|tara:strand:- start:4070 stop:4858 length:789 start_codon:yes stop_codon:yes gene_type:complete